MQRRSRGRKARAPFGALVSEVLEAREAAGAGGGCADGSRSSRCQRLYGAWRHRGSLGSRCSWLFWGSWGLSQRRRGVGGPSGFIASGFQRGGFRGLKRRRVSRSRSRGVRVLRGAGAEALGSRWRRLSRVWGASSSTESWCSHRTWAAAVGSSELSSRGPGVVWLWLDEQNLGRLEKLVQVGALGDERAGFRLANALEAGRARQGQRFSGPRRVRRTS
jgi:hypothetical protein